LSQFYFLGNSTRIQMLGCVVKTKNKTFVIDGGTEGDGAQLSSMLKKISDSHVDAWFFTHPHHDHMGAFVDILKNDSNIIIDKVLFNFPGIDFLGKYGVRSDKEITLWQEFRDLIDLRFSSKCKSIKAGDVFWFDDVSVNVLRVFNPTITENFINNSSAVYRIDSPSKKILILGDLGVEGGYELMNNVSAQNLYADYTQMAHHGQAGVSKEFYQYIKPRICLWAAPDWLWDYIKGGDMGSGPFLTLETRKWMDELGVTEHIIQKDGTKEIII